MTKIYEKRLEEEDSDTWGMLSEWTRREYHHKHGHGCQQGRGNEDDLDQPLEGQCNETCKLVTSLGLTYENARDRTEWRALLSALCT